MPAPALQAPPQLYTGTQHGKHQKGVVEPPAERAFAKHRHAQPLEEVSSRKVDVDDLAIRHHAVLHQEDEVMHQRRVADQRPVSADEQRGGKARGHRDAAQGANRSRIRTSESTHGWLNHISRAGDARRPTGLAGLVKPLDFTCGTISLPKLSRCVYYSLRSEKPMTFAACSAAQETP
jgi:hypothetical protein